MNNLDTPLTEAELEQLDRFLLDRIDEDAEFEDRDVGIIDISGLDGFLTAIVSGPTMVPPSHWLPAVWGEFEPAWESESDFMDIMALMMRHMNGIAGMLLEQPEDFEPLLYENEVDGRTQLIVDEWCDGYMRGVGLTMEDWDAGGTEITELVMPILMFVSEEGWKALDAMEPGEVEQMQQAVTDNARAIHAWWLERRERPISASTPVRRSSPEVGRNDPCPCGSGKKYKHCCLRQH
jgi:uncharacterized protein